MALFCSCGAELPDNARFCHKCGKPQRAEDAEALPVPAVPPELGPPPPVRIGFRNPTALRIGLLCATLSALLSSLPVANFGCCLWMFGSGFLAAWLYQRRTGLALSVGEGARLGFVTGTLTFAMGFCFTAAALLLMRRGGGIEQMFKESLARMPAQDEAARRVLDLLSTPGGMGALLSIYAVLALLLTVAITMGGAALGAKVMERDTR